MEPKQVNWFILTITFCLAFLVWGTIFVSRSVVDKNPPAPKPSVPSNIAAYEECAKSSYTKSEDCMKLAGVSASPAPATLTPSPAVKK